MRVQEVQKYSKLIFHSLHSQQERNFHKITWRLLEMFAVH